MRQATALENRPSGCKRQNHGQNDGAPPAYVAAASGMQGNSEASSARVRSCKPHACQFERRKKSNFERVFADVTLAASMYGPESCQPGEQNYEQLCMA